MNVKQFCEIILWPFKFIFLNLILLLNLPLALLPHENVKKGDRFLVLKDIKTNGLIHYDAPFTGGFRCIIPRGTTLIALSDSEKISLGFACIPANKEEFESKYILESDKGEKYAGFSFVLKYTEIGKRIKKLNT